MPSFPIYVIQDGADFYVYKDRACEDLLMTRTSPFPVLDHDIPAAEKARKWFIGLCSSQQVIHWPTNAYGDEL